MPLFQGKSVLKSLDIFHVGFHVIFHSISSSFRAVSASIFTGKTEPFSHLYFHWKSLDSFHVGFHELFCFISRSSATMMSLATCEVLHTFDESLTFLQRSAMSLATCDPSQILI